MGTRSHHVGRLRLKAADILSTAFDDGTVDGQYVYPSQGVYRSNANFDCVRWEAFVYNERGNAIKSLHSWETLTHFCKFAPKFGFTIGRDGDVYACESDADMKTVVKKIKKRDALYWKTRFISPDEIRDKKKKQEI